MKIIIGADLVPTHSNIGEFNNSDINTLTGEELAGVLSNADYRIYNLEVPLTDVESPIKKCGPALIAPTSTVNGIKALGADLCTLANNHIMDQGKQGLESTINVLSKTGVEFIKADEIGK